MAKKTTLEKINAVRAKIHVLGDKILALQDACPHTQVKVKHYNVGYDGYSTNWETSCQCELCEKSWFHDGYCTGESHGRAR